MYEVFTVFRNQQFLEKNWGYKQVCQYSSNMIDVFRPVRNIKKILRHFQEAIIYDMLLFFILVKNKSYKGIWQRSYH